MIIAVDFDGTIVDHRYPDIGVAVPGAFRWLKEWRSAGAKLILWTVRSDGRDGPVLAEAIEFCRLNGVYFDGHNTNPSQASWSWSPKCDASLYVDDAAFGCPLRENPRSGGRPYVDWDVVGPGVLDLILSKKKAGSP